MIKTELKKVLIIYPHFPPSNLVGVHRVRLFSQHLPSFGWDPIMLTVNEKYYEENLDHNLVKLLPKSLRIEKVKAYKRFGPIGDIGLRSFLQLYVKAKEIIQKEHIDLLYLSIPSFYCALLGRLLNRTTGIQYGIDYQDPWVHYFPGSDKIFSRHWLSTKMAKILEPIAVKKASLITGVAEGYYSPVLERNPHLKNVITGAMPMGGEIEDHKFADSYHLPPYLFSKKKGKIQMVYAGTMLPKAYAPLEKIFEAIVADKTNFSNVEFHFIGSGKSPDDAEGYNIKPLAERYGLWQDVIYEYPARIPYLDVLVHLNIADAIFILGSTEPHYTPSKVYQAILSGKPIFAVLHNESSAVNIIRHSGGGEVLDFRGMSDTEIISKTFSAFFFKFIKFAETFRKEQVNNTLFHKYSAFSVTEKLAALLNKTINKS